MMRPLSHFGICSALLLAPVAAWADGGAMSRESWWRAWDWQPGLLLGLAAAWWLYGRGALAAWERAGVGRGVSLARAAAFGIGIGALLLALVSPLDPLSAQLASAHMAQHLLLMMVAAPLLAFGTPISVGLFALPTQWRSAVARWARSLDRWYDPAGRVGQVAVFWTIHAAALWVWHLPALYEAALRSRAVHDLEHGVFLLTAFLFWRVLLDPLRRLRLNGAAGALYLFTACLQAGALGIYMTLSPRVWYPSYAATAPAWGLTPLEDQQAAGLIMWAVGGTIYAIAAAIVFGAWLRQSESAKLSGGRLRSDPALAVVLGEKQGA